MVFRPFSFSFLFLVFFVLCFVFISLEFNPLKSWTSIAILNDHIPLALNDDTFMNGGKCTFPDRVYV